MAAAWRDFEKLIARIEQAMAPSGAVVKSPDHIPDKLTGGLREVDASIRYKVGTCPVLITIECRDRSSIEDVTWIKQLAEKKRSVGASITLAVSSAGFTGPAIQKASASGVEIRTLAEATADDFVQWLKFQNVVLDVSEWSLANLGLDLYDGPQGAPPQDTELTPSTQQSFREKGPLAPILIRNSDGARGCIQGILAGGTKLWGSFFPGNLPDDGTKVPRNLNIPVERNTLHVETTNGNFDIRIIHISLWLSRSKRLVPVSRLTEYSDPSSPLVQTAEWNLMDKVKLSLHRNLESGETKVRVTPKD
ncbi:MAG: hypothetical protein WA188_18900 [Terriglobales bacterium]